MSKGMSGHQRAYRGGVKKRHHFTPYVEAMILTDRQRDLLRWHFVEARTYAEIGVWLECSKDAVRREIATLRAIFRSHGKELPHRPRGRPRKKGLPMSALSAA